MGRRPSSQLEVEEANAKKRKTVETSDEHKWKYAVDQYHGDNPFHDKKELHPLIHEVARSLCFRLRMAFPFMYFVKGDLVASKKDRRGDHARA